MGNIYVGELDKLKLYNKDDLGYTFDGEKHSFKLWSPFSQSVKVCIYNGNGIKESNYEMKSLENGVWHLSLKADLKGKYYTFCANVNGEIVESIDPYAKLVSVNGERAAILDMKDTNPDGWEQSKRVKLENKTDAIIYELHIRDISIDKDSGISNKGKFLGLTQDNTSSLNGVKTGLNHIKDLGVTHVQLLPIYDFANMDERKAKLSSESENNRPYNWGYDPQNYNAVEGSYSIDPYDPIARVKELKTLIKTIHKNGIGVIMDVVYNHISDVSKSPFHKFMPGYFFRYNKSGYLLNESGCGNALASERVMVRKFIVDSVKYWANEYKLDGFRFDLMGLLDIDTMNEIREELDKIDPSIIIIGEGWNMGATLSESKKAIQANAYKVKNIAFFNDTTRDALRGKAFEDSNKGFVNLSRNKTEIDVKKGIVGGIKYSKEITLWGDVDVNQVVNYVECHDNHTFYDKLMLSVKDENKIKPMHSLGTSIVLLSQGIPFLHAGQEFFRTKKGVENSYNSNDDINKIDWERKFENIDNVEYIKGLIKIRKKYKSFRMNSAEEIIRKLEFIKSPKNSIVYKLKGVDEDIIVIHNANEYSINIDFFKDSNFEILVEKDKVNIEGIRVIKSNRLIVNGISTLVAIVKKRSVIYKKEPI